jgi:hypothetical protein
MEVVDLGSSDEDEIQMLPTTGALNTSPRSHGIESMGNQKSSFSQGTSARGNIEMAVDLGEGDDDDDDLTELVKRELEDYMDVRQNQADAGIAMEVQQDSNLVSALESTTESVVPCMNAIWHAILDTQGCETIFEKRAACSGCRQSNTFQDVVKCQNKTCIKRFHIGCAAKFNGGVSVDEQGKLAARCKAHIELPKYCLCLKPYGEGDPGTLHTLLFTEDVLTNAV